MGVDSSPSVQEAIAVLFREESGRVLATLIRLLGDFDLAEDAMQDAFAEALRKWPIEGIPNNPRAWLVSAARFKGIDVLRRKSRFETNSLDAQELQAPEDADLVMLGEDGIEDDLLRLIFTCCHPVLAYEAQVALTLREVCGLTTEEIARAFLLPVPTLAQRIVRAKQKLRDSKVPYEVPQSADLPERLESVLRVTYLVFNEGYYATSGSALTRQSLSAEAIRLGRLVVERLPESEAIGLLALMLLSESRRKARTTASGDLILLDDQDRSLWDRALISEGLALSGKAGSKGAYAIQAAIAAVHAGSGRAEDTDWNEIVNLYDRLIGVSPSPVIDLNRAVAVPMRDGPAAGLVLLDGLLAGGGLENYGLAHSARADLNRRLGRPAQARASYQRALELATQEPERRFLQRRLDELTDPAEPK